MHWHLMSPTKHRSQRTLLIRTQCSPRSGYLMCPPDIQINYITLDLIHPLNLTLLLLPRLLLRLNLLLLMTLLPHKLDLLLSKFKPLIFEGVSLLPDQVLEVDHQLLDHLVCRCTITTFSRKEEVLDVLMGSCWGWGWRRPHWGVARLDGQVKGASVTSHLTEEHLDAVFRLGIMETDVVIVVFRLLIIIGVIIRAMLIIWGLLIIRVLDGRLFIRVFLVIVIIILGGGILWYLLSYHMLLLSKYWRSRCCWRTDHYIRWIYLTR